MSSFKETNLNKRNNLTIKDKLKIINEIKKGASKNKTAKKYNISESTLAAIVKSEGFLKIGALLKGDFCRKIRIPKPNSLEYNLLQKWDNKLNNEDILKKIDNIAKKLGLNGFKADDRWLQKFLTKYKSFVEANSSKITFEKAKDDSDTSDKTVPFALNDFSVKERTPLSLPNTMSLRDTYSNDDIFFIGQSILFYSVLPEDMTKEISECAEMNKLVLTICCNASGSEKVQLLVVSDEPRPELDPLQPNLPVEYVPASCHTSEYLLFRWILKLDHYFHLTKRKVLVIVPSECFYNKKERLRAINMQVAETENQVIGLSGILDELKKGYKETILKRYLIALQSNQSFNIYLRDALDNLAHVWTEMESSFIREHFAKAGVIRGVVKTCSDNSNGNQLMQRLQTHGKNPFFTFQSYCTFEEQVQQELAYKARKTFRKNIYFVLPTQDCVKQNGKRKEELREELMPVLVVSNPVAQLKSQTKEIELPYEAVVSIERLINYLGATKGTEQLLKELGEVQQAVYKELEKDISGKKAPAESVEELNIPEIKKETLTLVSASLTSGGTVKTYSQIPEIKLKTPKISKVSPPCPKSKKKKVYLNGKVFRSKKEVQLKLVSLEAMGLTKLNGLNSLQKDNQIFESHDEKPELLDLETMPVFNEFSVTRQSVASSLGETQESIDRTIQIWNEDFYATFEDRAAVDISKDGKVMIVANRYPKAKHHYLIVPKQPLLNLRNVNKSHLKILEIMEAKAIALIDRLSDHKSYLFIKGFIALPDNMQIHMHVISLDFGTNHMNYKEQWNSFNTKLFLTSEEVLRQIRLKGFLNLFNENEAKDLLEKQLRCHICDAPYDNLSLLKSHVQGHYS